MSESAPTPGPQPQPGQQMPGDQIRRHPIFGDDLDDPSIYGPEVSEREWLTGGAVDQPDQTTYTVDSIAAEYAATEQHEAAQQQRGPGWLRRALGHAAGLGAGISEHLPTEANHARHHVHELLEHAVFNRRGIKDDPGSKSERNLSTNPEAMALQQTIEWVRTRRALKDVPKGTPRADEIRYMPSNDRNADEIRHGVQHVAQARRSLASPEEQRQLADPRWSRLLDPANVRALRERVMAFTASPQAMGQGNEATRAYKRHETDRYLAQAGIKGIRPPQLLADYLDIKPEMLGKTGKGGAPEAVLNELNFLIRLDSMPLDSRGTTALDYLLPLDEQRRNAQLAAASRFVEANLQQFDRQFEDGRYPGHVSEAPADVMRRRIQAAEGSGSRRYQRESTGVASAGNGEQDTDVGILEEDAPPRAVDSLRWRRSQMRQMYTALPAHERSGQRGQDLQHMIDLLDAEIKRQHS